MAAVAFARGHLNSWELPDISFYPITLQLLWLLPYYCLVRYVNPLNVNIHQRASSNHLQLSSLVWLHARNCALSHVTRVTHSLYFRYLGCAALDTRVPRVQPLERYIEEVFGPRSSGRQLTVSFVIFSSCSCLTFYHIINKFLMLLWCDSSFYALRIFLYYILTRFHTNKIL